MDMQEFVMTEHHIKLLMNMNVGWDGCEFGAPCIDPKRPYGNSSVYEDMAKILGFGVFIDVNGELCFSEGQVKMLDELHSETETALQIVLSTGSFEPGTYVAKKYSDNWTRKE